MSIMEFNNDMAHEFRLRWKILQKQYDGSSGIRVHELDTIHFIGNDN